MLDHAQSLAGRPLFVPGESPKRMPVQSHGMGCFGMLAIIMLLPLFAGAAVLVDAVALDRLGWIDFGYPNYIRETKPDGARLIAEERCCYGATGIGGVTQFFYGTNMPFYEVAAHYRVEMGRRGYASGTSSEPDWLSGHQEIWFDEPGSLGGRSFKVCFTITPFTNDYDLEKGLWVSNVDARSDELRSKLSKFSHPYVAQYTSSSVCGG